MSPDTKTDIDKGLKRPASPNPSADAIDHGVHTQTSLKRVKQTAPFSATVAEWVATAFPPQSSPQPQPPKVMHGNANDFYSSTGDGLLRLSADCNLEKGSDDEDDGFSDKDFDEIEDIGWSTEAVINAAILPSGLDSRPEEYESPDNLHDDLDADLTDLEQITTHLTVKNSTEEKPTTKKPADEKRADEKPATPTTTTA
ncbi:hypothetical protein HDV00_002905 [Rhizophlyctis rosea]|nr:hypothetical protein HDV00_002905 [Rhizophlyctis rosea]